MTDADTRELTEEMAYRWNQPTHAVLPDEVIRRIVPLSEEKAREVFARLRPLVDVRDGCLVGNRFHATETADASGPDESVRRWLLGLGLAADTKVIIQWSDQWAITTDFGIFCGYWEAFCYPSSDDVVIWPFDDAWLLFYHHEETFSFGNRRW